MKKLNKYMYYNNPDVVLYHGDCLEVLKLIKNQIKVGKMEAYDMIFADPPYNLSNGGFTCKNGRQAPVHKGDWDKSRGILEDHNFNLRWLKACKDVLKEDGTLWVTGTYHVIYSVGFAAQIQGYKILNDICWYKPNAAPNLSCRYFTASHETVLWLAKSDKTKHAFNYPVMREQNSGKQMRSVWTIPTTPPREKRHGKHPTQKPLSLLKRLIEASTTEGQLVLDPFCGSGTTGLACTELGRRFNGIEMQKEYLDLTLARIKDSKMSQVL